MWCLVVAMALYIPHGHHNYADEVRLLGDVLIPALLIKQEQAPVNFRKHDVSSPFEDMFL